MKQAPLTISNYPANIFIVKVKLLISSRALPSDLAAAVGHQVTKQQCEGSVGHNVAVMTHDTDTLNLTVDNNVDVRSSAGIRNNSFLCSAMLQGTWFTVLTS